MTPADTDWERLLGQATLNVMHKVSSLTGSKMRGRILGTGASGDETLLADQEAEDELLIALRGVRGLRVLSEESGETGHSADASMAVIDPLDGSSNFSKGLPFYCTSIAISDGPDLRDVRVAMVRNLVNGDVYFAKRGKGATKNGVRIGTSKVRHLSESALGVDLSGSRRSHVERFSTLLSTARRALHYGANALEICLVAEGKIDGFIDLRRRLRVTDIAGCSLIAKEAGAFVSLASAPSVVSLMSLRSRFNVVISGNRHLHAEILNALDMGRNPPDWLLGRTKGLSLSAAAP